MTSNHPSTLADRVIAIMDKLRTPEAVTAEAQEDIWGPLERLVGPAKCAQFMYMGTTGGLSLYKHVNTRRYLNISEDGRTWKYTGSNYQPQDSKEAVEYAFS
jgi:hypothetical protein